MSSPRPLTPPTLDRVARAAGVSRATASRALNGGTASPDAIRAVTEAANRLGFQPNRAAQSLAKRRTDMVALVITEEPEFIFQDLYLSRLIAAISAGFWQRQLQPILVLMDPSDPQTTVGRILRRGNIDGMVVTSFHSNPQFEATLAAADLPTVFVGRPPQGKAYPHVDADNHHGGLIATQHLIGLGRRHIACLGGPLNMTSPQDRREGFLAAHAAAGQEPGPYVEAVYHVDAGYVAAKRLLATHPETDAIFAQSDSLAAGALRALEEAGLSVPGDVALVGFDDSSLAVQVVPKLTTVAQPVKQMAASAAELLALRLETGEWGPHPKMWPTNLVIRESA